MDQTYLPRLNDLRLRDAHAEAARDRLVARVRPATPGVGTTPARFLTAALAALAMIVGVR